MTDKAKDADLPKGESKEAGNAEASKARPSLDEIRKSKNTFGGNGTFGGSKIGGSNSRGKGGGLSRPGGSARGR